MWSPVRLIKRNRLRDLVRYSGGRDNIRSLSAVFQRYSLSRCISQYRLTREAVVRTLSRLLGPYCPSPVVVWVVV